MTNTARWLRHTPLRTTLILGRLVLTTTMQGEGAPMIDGAMTRTADGHQFGSVCLMFRRGPRRGLVVGWRDRPAPFPDRWPIPAALTRARIQ